MKLPTWQEVPFQPGEEIEYYGKPYVVIANYGQNGLVINPNAKFFEWSEDSFEWQFNGQNCKRTGRKFDLSTMTEV